MEVKPSPYLMDKGIDDGMRWCRIQAEIMSVNMDLSRESRKPGSGWREEPVECEECSSSSINILFTVSFAPGLRGRDCVCRECSHRFSEPYGLIPPDPQIQSDIAKIKAKLRKLDELLKETNIS